MLNLEGIKNVIFDLGGVLLNLDFNLTKKAFEELGVKDFDGYYSKAQQTNLFDKFEIGEISELEFCEQLKILTGICVSNSSIIDAWNAMLLDFPIIRKKVVLSLKDHFNTSLLSNTNETHVRAFNKIIQNDINESSLNPLFNRVYFSNEIGKRKPNKEVFEFVLTQNNYQASETLFLDDSIQHIEGAKLCGINTVHIQNNPVEELFVNFLA